MPPRHRDHDATPRRCEDEDESGGAAKSPAAKGVAVTRGGRRRRSRGPMFHSPAAAPPPVRPSHRSSSSHAKCSRSAPIRRGWNSSATQLGRYLGRDGFLPRFPGCCVWTRESLCVACTRVVLDWRADAVHTDYLCRDWVPMPGRQSRNATVFLAGPR